MNNLRFLAVSVVAVLVLLIASCAIPQSATVTVRNSYSGTPYITATVDGSSRDITYGSSRSFSVDWEGPLGGSDKSTTLRAAAPNGQSTSRRVTLSDGDSITWTVSGY